MNLLPKEVIPKSYQDKINKTPQCESFMHLHLGFDAEVRSHSNLLSAYCWIVVDYNTIPMRSIYHSLISPFNDQFHAEAGV